MDSIKKETNSKTEESVLAQIDTQKVIKFFVVDDDEYFNQLVISYLRKIAKENGFHPEISGFTDGATCVSHMRENPDFVILDFYLDENNDIILTGYDVLEKIQHHNDKINTIVMSQKHEWENFEDEFVKFGASGFLKKDDNFYKNLKSMVLRGNIGIA